MLPSNVETLGVAPAVQGADKTKDVGNMKKVELMKYAKNVLGVETRRRGDDGKENLFRLVEDARQDCKAVQPRQRQASPGNQESEAPAEVSSSSHEAPPLAPERAQSAPSALTIATRLGGKPVALESGRQAQKKSCRRAPRRPLSGNRI